MPIVHPLVVRICHWLNALAVLLMLTSGWRIYDASPLFGFIFPSGITLGGWLAGALQWHFAAMWLLVSSGLAYLVYGILSGYYRRNLLPSGRAAVTKALADFLHGHLEHRMGSYNPLQRIAYITAIMLACVLVLSGAVLWKPVQLQEIAWLVGGYDGARYVHFFAMTGMTLFIFVHVFMAILVPRTLIPMLTGRAA